MNCIWWTRNNMTIGQHQSSHSNQLHHINRLSVCVCIIYRFSSHDSTPISARHWDLTGMITLDVRYLLSRKCLFTKQCTNCCWCLPTGYCESKQSNGEELFRKTLPHLSTIQGDCTNQQTALIQTQSYSLKWWIVVYWLVMIKNDWYSNSLS